jgi:hypothetical protein
MRMHALYLNQIPEYVLAQRIVADLILNEVAPYVLRWRWIENAVNKQEVS